MNSIDEFKQAIKAGKIAEAFLVAMSQAVELKITTWVASNTPEDNTIGLNPSKRLQTRINLLEGVENEIGEEIIHQDYDDLRQFHWQQVESGTEIILNHLETLEKILNLVTNLKKQQEIINQSTAIGESIEVKSLVSSSVKPEKLLAATEAESEIEVDVSENKVKDTTTEMLTINLDGEEVTKNTDLESLLVNESTPVELEIPPVELSTSSREEIELEEEVEQEVSTDSETFTGEILTIEDLIAEEEKENEIEAELEITANLLDIETENLVQESDETEDISLDELTKELEEEILVQELEESVENEDNFLEAMSVSESQDTSESLPENVLATGNSQPEEAEEGNWVDLGFDEGVSPASISDLESLDWGDNEDWDDEFEETNPNKF